MRRRIFIRNGALAGLGVGLTGLHACSSSTGKKETAEDTSGTKENIPKGESPFFELSLAQWSIHRMIWEQGLDPYLFASLGRKWGFKALEYVSGLFIDREISGGDLTRACTTMVQKLKKASTDEGMVNHIMMVDLLPERGDIAVSDKVKRVTAVENHYPYVDATAELGCPNMRINLFGALDAEVWKPAALEGLRMIGEYAQKANVNILIENHGYLSSRADLLMEVINEVGLENCGTLPDFGNFCLRREGHDRWSKPCIEEYDKYKGVEEMMPAAFGVSAKSYDFNDQGKSWNKTQSEVMDYARFLQIVKDAGYTGYIGVEYEGNNLSEEEGIIATKKLLLDSAKALS